MGKRFVSVPTDRIVSMLDEIGEAVTRVGGRSSWSVTGKERVFELVSPPRTPRAKIERSVQVYTSIAAGASSARACGKDAVRIVVGVIIGDQFRPVAKSTKLLRTAPVDLTGNKRIESFLERFKGAIRTAYRQARNTSLERCAKCDSIMVPRAGKHGDFMGCLAYPVCRNIRNI